MRRHPVAVVCFLFLLGGIAPSADAPRGKLLVENNGTLLLITPDGSATAVGKWAIAAALSPDGKAVAFTTDVVRPSPTTPEKKVVVKTLPAGPETEIVKIPRGAYFRDLEWLPDGKTVAYQAVVHGKSGELFFAPVPPAGEPPRKLGDWYQGISFSPDGSKLLHAVNGPGSPGLEIVETGSGKRAMLHVARSIVWEARYSPDGRYIAYTMTLRNPPLATDEEPNCAGPTIGLWLYSVANHSDTQVVIRAAPKDWDNVKNFRWSPDGRRIALTLGTTDCDYPGSAAGVFLTAADQKQQLRLSTSDLSVEPAFSPEGAAVAFVDVSEPRSKLMLYDLRSGKLTLIRQAGEQANWFTLLGWK